MSHTKRMVVGGVDTHSATHHAAIVDEQGRLLGDAEFPATPNGYAKLLSWMQALGRLDRVGVEGTGAYGAGLAVTCTSAVSSYSRCLGPIADCGGSAARVTPSTPRPPPGQPLPVTPLAPRSWQLVPSKRSACCEWPASAR